MIVTIFVFMSVTVLDDAQHLHAQRLRVQRLRVQRLRVQRLRVQRFAVIACPMPSLVLIGLPIRLSSSVIIGPATSRTSSPSRF